MRSRPAGEGFGTWMRTGLPKSRYAAGMNSRPVLILLVGGLTISAVFPGGMAGTEVLGPETVEASPFNFVLLEPALIAEKAESGETFTLPTMWGDVTVATTARASDGVDIYHADANGNLIHDGFSIPDVWHIASPDGTMEGILLADGLQVRATLVTPHGRSTIEPGMDGLPTGAAQALHRMYAEEPTRPLIVAPHPQPIPGDPTPRTRGGDIGILSTITLTQAAYADNEFVSVWGSTGYDDHILYLTTWVNGYMNDVEIVYDVNDIINSDPGTDSSSAWSQGWDWLGGQSNQGEDGRVLWSHVDYDGCTLGQALQPGDRAMLQTTDDSCHGWNVIDTDFERAFFMTHELGHNNDANHDDAWVDIDPGHTHRSFMQSSANWHPHECWSSANADNMVNHNPGTSVQGTTCD